MPKSITSSSIPEFFILQARPWLPPWGTESWPARTPWVLGFSPVGGNRVYSEGGPVNDLSRKGKEDCRNSWWCLRSTRKRTTCSTLAWFLALALGSAVFPRAKFARGPTVPRTEASAAGEHQKVWCARRRRGTLPIHGAGGKCSRGPTVEREGSKKVKIKKQKKDRREKWPSNNLTQFGILAVLE